MMNTQGMSPTKIKMLGVEILNRELGPDGLIEFIQQFDLGHGDYTKERESLFKDDTVQSLGEELLKYQKGKD